MGSSLPPYSWDSLQNPELRGFPVSAAPSALHPPKSLLCIRHRSSSSARLLRPEPNPTSLLQVPSISFVCRVPSLQAMRPFLDFFPSPATSHAGSVLPGFASPSTFPSRGFSPPQGFASCTASWPCFMPQPLMRFHSPSESSPCW